MNIQLSKEAVKWFQDEMMIKEGDHVRFFVKYGGSSKVQDGFSLGVSKDEPMEAAVTREENGITFFIEEQDVWYFDDHDLEVNYNESSDGPSYDYSKN
ncbi:HesB/YadR/YfhF family protein [Jeotgalibacillus proteolyticus]|uniref:Core domain-containing protein n=1 Tax=Jeotgalibacillus proteolyticus TaxID=2082395 RepID=A0A2S5GGF1_9BACL|nr:HesB/YadR/YfhF family protein [Jeotgalibacillus proteolyticus]PPA71943.1 hypothetical protein C4B60_00770 [Jeotgalibacillus proteolyticus]